MYEILVLYTGARNRFVIKFVSDSVVFSGYSGFLHQ